MIKCALHQVLTYTYILSLNYLYFTEIEFYGLTVTAIILTHPVDFLVGGNRSTRRKPKTFSRALTNSFHIRTELEPLTSRQVHFHFVTEVP